MKVLGICGGLRKDSCDGMALRAAQNLLPLGVEMEIASLRDIPMYDEDVRSQGEPAAVIRAARTKFDHNGELVDAATAKFVADLPASMRRLADRLQSNVTTVST